MSDTIRKKDIAERWIVEPINTFISNSKTSGIILFCSALVALIISNSPLKEDYHHLWEHYFSIGYDNYVIKKNLHHWINDGLMAVFFFVVGLELKREILFGQLREPKNAILPIVAAIGGMLFPALIYLIFNGSGYQSKGWGIPMATDIAFALGILYLLGDKVPTALKVFLTAIAIVDDLGAVLVIAFFYTSQIDFISLLTGLGFMVVLIAANLIGVRNTVFYGIVGIGGVWLAFLLSGVHATIAAVLAAFAIPASTNINEEYFSSKLEKLYNNFKQAKKNNNALVTHEQQEILEKIKYISKNAIPPLQRLEHNLHPLVAFVIMPIFALSNAGVTITGDIKDVFTSNVTFGIAIGLIIGKLLGIVGASYIFIKLKIASLPQGLSMSQLLAVGFLGAIGFTMSLFISGLAFNDPDTLMKAKVGVLTASIIASIIGYSLVKRSLK
ncbi:MAG: Na+/H+ antiporter NhaA [Bacteroidia bacterium]